MSKLIPEARQAWKLLSMQLSAAAVVFGLLDHTTQVAVLAFLNIPAERIPAILGIMFMVTRLVRQPSVRE